MKTAFDFICFALSHAKKDTLPSDALLPVPPTYVGSDGEWEYLYGTTGWTITQALLDERYKHYYKNSYTEKKYKEITNGFVGRIACDCEGLLDYFLGVDVNANANYTSWCTSKGLLSDMDEQLEIGTALFKQGDSGKMNHVGFICGYLPNGDTLIVEERGIKHGCVITKLSERNFTHYGKPTAKLDFSEPICIWNPTVEPIALELANPRHRGEEYKIWQMALNYVGAKDSAGRALVEDGIWGPNSQYALDAFVASRAPHLSVMLTVNDKVVYNEEVN